MIADRGFRISPPREGSKLTHQTSPRCIETVLHGDLCPVQSLSLPLSVLRHLFISTIQVRVEQVGANLVFDEPADPARAHHFAQTAVNLSLKRNGQFPVHTVMLSVRVSHRYVSNTYMDGYRFTILQVEKHSRSFQSHRADDLRFAVCSRACVRDRRSPNGLMGSKR